MLAKIIWLEFLKVDEKERESWKRELMMGLGSGFVGSLGGKVGELPHRDWLELRSVRI